MKNFPLNLEHFILIKTIVNLKSFKKSAKHLGVSQASVTTKIKKLEDSLQVQIFNRNRGLSLTTAGYILFRYSEKITFLCEEAYKTLQDFQIHNDILSVGASQTVGTYLMPQILSLFKKNYPNINIQLQIHSTRRIAWYVANGQLDFAMVGGNIPKDLRTTLEVIPYAEDELALILPTYHPLSGHKEIKKEELYRLNFITLNTNSTIQNAINKTLNSSGIDTKRLIITMELNTIEGIKNAVESGLGTAFISVSAIKRELKLKTLHGTRVEGIMIKRQLSIIVHPNRYKRKINKTFEMELPHLFGALPLEKNYLINNYTDIK